MFSAQRRTTIRRLLAFGAIGLASTVAYAALYLLFRLMLGATLSNAAALVITAIANTAANRRVTFGVRDREHLWRDHAAGLLAFVFALAITTAAANVVTAAGTASHALELTVLVAANALATIVRFVILHMALASRTSERMPRQLH